MGTLATDPKIEGSHFIEFGIINFLLNHRLPWGSIWSVHLSINVKLGGWKSNSGLICTAWLAFDEQKFRFCFPLLKKKCLDSCPCHVSAASGTNCVIFHVLWHPSRVKLPKTSSSSWSSICWNRQNEQ